MYLLITDVSVNAFNVMVGFIYLPLVSMSSRETQETPGDTSESEEVGQRTS